MAYYGAQKNNPELKKAIEEYESKLQENLSLRSAASPENNVESTSFTGCGVGDLLTLAETTVFPVYVQSPQGAGSSATGPQYPANGLLWVMNMGLRYQNRGCSWWGNRLSLWGQQLAGMIPINSSNPQALYHYQLKMQKHNFALQALTVCGCQGQGQPLLRTSQPLEPLELNPGSEAIIPEGYGYSSSGVLRTNEELNQENIIKQTQIVEKKKLVVTEKVIEEFSINTGDLKAGGEVRPFEIIGEEGAMFTMEVYDADGNYYNFSDETWSSTKYRLNKSVIRGNSYKGIINFSNIASKLHVYTILLFAEDTPTVKTVHSEYIERKFSDGTIDINRSSGSNSKLLKKTISQAQEVTLRISAMAPRRGDANEDTVDGAISSGTNIVMDTPYTTKKVEVGDKLSGTNIAAGTYITAVNVSGTNDRYTLSTAVSGSVSDGATLIFTGPFADTTPRYGTTTGSDSTTVSTGSHGEIYSFSITLTAASGRSFTLLRQPTENDLLYVSLVNMGAAASAIDGEDTSSSALFYRWPVNNVAGLASNMILDPSKLVGQNATLDSIISDYKQTTTVSTKKSIQLDLQKQKIQEEYLKDYSEEVLDEQSTETIVFVKGVTTTGSPTINRLGITTAVAGNLVFNKQQVDALKSDTNVKILGYGLSAIKQMSFGTELKFSNLAAELQAVTTTVSTDASGTSISIAERAGIMDGVSTVTGAGITTTPHVVSGASGNTGSGAIVVSASQSIEQGQTLTFSGASNVVTITGDVEIVSMAESNTTIYFDMEKFLTCF